MMKYFFCFAVLVCVVGCQEMKHKTVRQFIDESNRNWNDPNNAEIRHVVLGNESVDLDSIVASIAEAYLLSQQTGRQYYPVLNITEAELPLRKDALYLFRMMNIAPHHLIFLNTSPTLQELSQDEALRLTLVDHNSLPAHQKDLAKDVERIIDHHVDENQFQPLLKSENKQIEEVGAATTLVAERYLAQPNLLSPELALFMMAPILLDTVNLTSVEKTTEKDKQVVSSLKKYAKDKFSEDFYDRLLKAKVDISGLSPSQLLLKDYKGYTTVNGANYGIASMPSSVAWWLEDASDLEPFFDEYLKEKNLSLLIVLLFNQDQTDGAPKRKLIVYADSADVLKDFQTFVQNDSSLKSLLKTVSGDETHPRFVFYTVRELIARKKLQPMLQQMRLQKRES